jgi:hypothetical protein
VVAKPVNGHTGQNLICYPPGRCYQYHSTTDPGRAVALIQADASIAGATLPDRAAGNRQSERSTAELTDGRRKELSATEGSARTAYVCTSTPLTDGWYTLRTSTHICRPHTIPGSWVAIVSIHVLADACRPCCVHLHPWFMSRRPHSHSILQATLSAVHVWCLQLQLQRDVKRRTKTHKDTDNFGHLPDK